MQELAGFNALLDENKELSEGEMRDSIREIAAYIESKFNRTMTYEETRTMPSLIQRIIADDVMKKRWKFKNEARFFQPYEAGDDKSFA